NSRLYSTTGGQTVAMRGSEPPVAQPVSEIAAITRAASRRIEHPALDVIGLLRGFEAFRQPSRTLARAPQSEQEQEHRKRDSAVAQRRPHPRADSYRAEQGGNH